MLIPYVIGFVENNKWLMFISLFLAGCSDLFDGLCARRLNQCTKLGAVLDPMRDRLLLLSVLINILYIQGIYFLWPWMILLISLELLIIALNYLYYFSFHLRQDIKAHLAGKIRQAAHLLLSGLSLLNYYFNDILSVFGVDLSFFSFELTLGVMFLFSFVALAIYAVWACVDAK